MTPIPTPMKTLLAFLLIAAAALAQERPAPHVERPGAETACVKCGRETR